MPLSHFAERRKLTVPNWDTANIYSNGDSEVTCPSDQEYEIPRHKLVLMTKACSCVGEQQFHAYPIIEDLKKTKDYVDQFGEHSNCIAR